MGAGQCGLSMLSQILSRQPSTRVTHAQPPLLPWKKQPHAPGICERLQRMAASGQEERIGDVASFYLPYVEEAIEAVPDIRIICLYRPREEIVAAFCRELDRSSQLRVNHWAKEPVPGWYHDPFWTRCYPQYDTHDREEGIGHYWDEYYTTAEKLARRNPGNVRICDTAAFTTEVGVREVLTFAGVPQTGQVLVIGRQMPRERSAAGHAPAHSSGAAQISKEDTHDRRKCVILVPFSGFIHQDCDNSLKELERRGYPVRRVGNYANIDIGRNQMATDALRDGFEETLWIDSDVGFHPDSVERLRSHSLPMVCGIYPKKGNRAVACHVMPGTPAMVFGEQGGLVELKYAATGFLLVRREVYLQIQSRLNLPMCNERFGEPMIPFFHSMLHPHEDGYWFLGDDYAFCQRAQEAGIRIFADTTIRLWHIGMYRYGWEDAGIEPARFSTFTLSFNDQTAAPPAVSPSLEEDWMATAVGRARVSDLARVSALAARHPWPAVKPDVPAAPQRNWLFQGSRDMLWRSLPPGAGVIVEVGSWTGRTTRFLADLAPQATVIAIDHWEGSVEHMQDPELAEFLPRLFETFLAECWEYRDRVVPLRARSVEGLQCVAAAAIHPDLVYIDADHQYESVVADLTTTLELFPETTIVGDDWDWADVRRAVETVTRQQNLRIETVGNAWRILR